MKYVIITGTSRGLGKGIAQAFMNEYNVIGISRSESPLKKDYSSKYVHIFLNLSYLSIIEPTIVEFFENIKNTIEIDYLILNAGILGTIKDLQETTHEEIQNVMNINVWANKMIIDALLRLEKKNLIRGPSKILAISSGASISGNRGWNAYAISKSSLNMLIKLYAAELPQKTFISLAPGLIHTKMQDEIYYKNIDLEKYPSFKRLIDARNTPLMPDSIEVGNKIYSMLDKIFSHPSGSYVDIRNL